MARKRRVQPAGEGRENVLRIRLTVRERGIMDEVADRGHGLETSTWAREVLLASAEDDLRAQEQAELFEFARDEMNWGEVERTRAERLALAVAYLPRLRLFMRYYLDLPPHGKRALREFLLGEITNHDG